MCRVYTFRHWYVGWSTWTRHYTGPVSTKRFSSIRLVFTSFAIQTPRTSIHHLTNYLSAKTVLLFTPQTELNIPRKLILEINSRKHLARVLTQIGREIVVGLLLASKIMGWDPEMDLNSFFNTKTGAKASEKIKINIFTNRFVEYYYDLLWNN